MVPAGGKDRAGLGDHRTRVEVELDTLFPAALGEGALAASRVGADVFRDVDRSRAALPGDGDRLAHRVSSANQQLRAPLPQPGVERVQAVEQQLHPVGRPAGSAEQRIVEDE